MTNIIALQTDYGKDSPKVKALKDELHRLSVGCELYDAVHVLPKGDIVAASTGIYSALQFYPQNSVYLSDVRDKKDCILCAAKTKDGHFIVTPDNGSLTAWYNFFGLESVVRIQNLAEAAAILADSPESFSNLGPEYKVSDVVLITAQKPFIENGYVITSMFSIVKGFGNLNLNVTYEEFEQSGIKFDDSVDVVLTKSGKEVFSANNVLYAKSFGYVKPKDPVLFNGSTGYMGFGLNIDNFCEKYMPEVYSDNCDLSVYKMTIRRSK